MIATLDGLYENGDERLVLEIKTMSREWNGELPDYWRIQGIQQAICADVDVITWAIFDSTMVLYIHEQKITDAEKQEHCDAVAKWLTSIDLGITPDGNGHTKRLAPDIRNRRARQLNFRRRHRNWSNN
ncbi:MAG: hypothetical protein FJ308_24395 [Planctomycetes bacterium]|nr:hypothetical protein [Planctomycetota bacterium]